MNVQVPLQSPGAPLAHYVSDKPFDVGAVAKLTPAQERIYFASQWKLMWWKFKRHRMAVVSSVFLALIYATLPVSEFLAPYEANTRHTDFIRAPPQRVHLFHEGQLVGPFVYGLDYKLNMENLRREYVVDRERPQKLRFFCHGAPYDIWGLIPSDRHLVCPPDDGKHQDVP